jgi:DNA gyrase subunit A
LPDRRQINERRNDIVLITRQGMSLRFHEEQLRDQGRNTVGVWGIRPDAGDVVGRDRDRESERHAARAGENGHRQANAV